MNDTVLRFRDQANRANLSAQADSRHKELLALVGRQQSDTTKAFNALLGLLQSGNSKVTVANQISSLSTPDVAQVTTAVKQVEAELKKHENTDLSPLTAKLEELLQETKRLPKDLPSLVVPDSMNVSNLNDYSDQLAELLTAIKALKLVAEAPVVNVPETVVNVPELKLKPLQDDIKDMSQAVGKELKNAVTAIKLNAPKEERPTVGLITEPFDEYRLNYDRFNADDPEARVESIEYYRDSKQIFKVEYIYDIRGRLTGGKRI
jgi:hypothetical protein